MEKRQCSQWSAGQNSSEVSNMPAWPSLCECLRSAGDLPTMLAWGCGPLRPGLGEGRRRLGTLDRPRPAPRTGKLGTLDRPRPALRAGKLGTLDRPRPAPRAGNLGRAARWGQSADALLGETQPSLPPNIR